MQILQRIPRISECPLCSNNTGYGLWSASSKEAAQHFVLKEKHFNRFLELVSHIETLWSSDTCEIVQCDRCGFCYSNPYIAGDSRFYDLAYEGSGGYPKWKWEFQETYEAIKKLAKSDLKLMEIGAGDGAFIRRIAEEILPKENIFCTEFSRYGRHRIEYFGVKCSAEDVRCLSDSNSEYEDAFDIVCMFQVLEHMDRLELLFKKLNLLMKSGGNLFISVPNQRLIEFNENNGALLDMPPNHVGRWNIRCFEKIAEQYGFHIVSYKVEEFDFASIVKQFVTYRFLRNSQRSGSFENKIQIMENRYLRGIMRRISLAVNSVMAMPALRKMDSGMGNSQWIQLIKREKETSPTRGFALSHTPFPCGTHFPSCPKGHSKIQNS